MLLPPGSQHARQESLRGRCDAAEERGIQPRFWILQNREEAEDVVQEAYLRAFRAFPRFKGDSVRPSGLDPVWQEIPAC